MCADLQVFKNQIKDSSFKKLFSSLSLFQKISLGVILLAVIVGLISLSKWANKPDYVVLFNNLSYSDSASIIEKLNESKIEYQISENGDVIKVKKSDLANARIALAAAGIPNNSVVGFELFDQQFFGLTDFTQQVNYQRALEGELSRTISEIEEVESARVHLVLSQDELFTEETKGASASVILKLKPGKSIGNTSVIAIKNLVAHAVKNLSEDGITIVDTAGNLLTVGDSSSQLASEQQKLAQEIENDLENKIASMLSKVFGLGNAIVSVKAEINNDLKESESETFLPGETGQGVALKKSVLSETYNRDISDAASGDKAGTDTNVPVVEQDANENIPSYKESMANKDAESNVYNRNEEQAEYGVSRIIEKVKYGTGNIKRLSVGVFLNSDISAQKMDAIEKVIIAAAGIDKARGDVVSIEKINFADTDSNLLSDETVDKIPFTVKLADIAKTALPGGLIVILLLLLTLRSMGKLKKKTILTEQDRKRLLEKIDTELGMLSGESSSSIYSGLSEAKDTASVSSGDEKIPNFFAPRVEALSKEEKKKKIMEIRKKVLAKMDETMYPELKEVVTIEAAENPQAAAKAIRNWLAGNV